MVVVVTLMMLVTLVVLLLGMCRHSVHEGFGDSFVESVVNSSLVSCDFED